MKSVKSSRKVVIESAKNTLTEKAELEPVKLLEGFLMHPHLLSGVQDIGVIFDTLLAKGMYDKLVQLANQRTLPSRVRKILVGRLL